MAIYNENYLMEFYNLQESASLSNNSFTQEDIKQVESNLKKIINNFNKDSKKKKEVLKELEDYYDEYSEDDNLGRKSDFVKFIPFICKLFKNNKSELQYKICDQNDGYCYGVSSFVADIAEQLEDSMYEYEKTLNDSYFLCNIMDEDDGIVIIQKYKK